MRPCGDCPFMKSSPLAGSPDWLRDILEYHVKDQYFEHTCHKTDPKADGYVGGKKRECKGHLFVIMNEHDKTPGKSGVYDSIEQMAKTYMDHWGVKLPPGARLVHISRNDSNRKSGE